MLDHSFALFTREEMTALADKMEAQEIERRLRYLAQKCRDDLEFNRFAGFDLMTAISTTLLAGAEYIAKTLKEADADSTV
jgi:hypothetical protein